MLHYMKDDHPSYRRNFCSWEKKAWKKKKQANWEQVVEFVRYKPLKDDDKVMNIRKAFRLFQARTLSFPSQFS